MQDLMHGYGFPTPENLSEWTRRDTVHEDGTYSVTFVKDELPSLKDKTYVQKQLFLKEHYPTEMGIVIKYNGPKAIFFGTYEKQFRTAGRRIFASRNWNDVLRYDGRRVISNRGFSFKMRCELECLLAFFGLEAVYAQNPRDVIETVFRNKQVLKGLFSQRITNMHDAMKTWLQSSCKVRISDLNYRVLTEYLSCRALNAMEIINLSEFTTSLETSMSVLTRWSKEKKCLSEKRERSLSEEKRLEKAHEMLSLLEDSLQDARTLDKRINFAWSERRLNEEHLKNTELIMVYSGGELSDAPVHDIPDNSIVSTENGLDLRGQILNDQRSVFREGTLMHHCIYTNYWRSIYGGSYLALSFTSPERVTVGLRQRYDMKKHDNTDTVEVDQMHTVCNGNPSDAFREAVRAYVRRNQEFFDSLLRDGKNTAPCTVRAVNEDLPF